MFATWPGIDVASAGTDAHAANPVTAELLAWADIIFVMEKSHRNKISKRFRSSLKSQRIICLNIPDDYEFMDAELVELLKGAVEEHANLEE